MARPLRIQYPGALYHVTSRGNEKKVIFKNDEDRRVFLEIFKEVSERFLWRCHAYVLMDNHYHLVIETLEGNLSKGMKHLNGVYTQRFNKKYRRVGHLFQGRFKAILIEKESHLLEVCRYVVMNPVRAKIANNPQDWKWSSYRGTAGLDAVHSYLTTEWILGQFGTRHREEAKQRYRKFIMRVMEEDTIWTEVKGQIILGEKDFVEEFMHYLKGKIDIKEIPKGQRYVHRPMLDSLFDSRILKNKRNRNKKIHEAVDKWGYTQKEVAEYLMMHYSTVSRLLKDIRISKLKT